MTVLGLETATAVCSVGIARGDGAGAERQLREPRIHSERILSLISDLLRSQKLDLTMLDAIAVSQGPGSFTGLRIGFSTAKGLWYATGKPLVLVPTLDAMAQAGSAQVPKAGNILVALDAKKGDFYSGLYRFRDGHMVHRTDASVAPFSLMRHPEQPDLVLTDRIDLLSPLFPGADVRSVLDSCRGDVIASMGAERAKAGEFADPATCEPAYLKDFEVKGRAAG